MASAGRSILLFGVLFVACGGESPPPLSDLESLSRPIVGERCAIGDERRCQEVIEQNSGVHTCHWGTQTCGAEGWGRCENGRTFRVPEASPERRPLSQSGDPVSCQNRCDPACLHWIEPGNLSGGLDLSVPHFPGTSGSGEACAHELCSTGPALDASCDPCAALVCADDPVCCGAFGGTWDSLCVDAVYETCLMQPRPLSLCDFGVFSTSASQVTINNLLSSSDITVGGYGNITLSGSSGKSVRRILTNGPVYLGNQEFPPLGIVAMQDITLDSSTSNVPVGPLESGQSISMYNRPIVDGNVAAQGNVVWETNVYGNVLAKGSISLDGGCAGSVFGGTCTSSSSHAPPSLALPTEPAQTFTCGGVDQNVGSGNLTLTPGNYGSIYVGGRLTLNGSGTYNFNTLYVRELQILSDDLTQIEVCNEFNVLENGRVLGATGTLLSDPSRLFVSVRGNLHFDGGVNWVGVVLAGSSGTKTGGTIHGAIWASPVNDINSQSSIVGISTDACVSMGIPGTAPPACPIVTSAPGVPPALVEPCRSGDDCQINRSCTDPVTGSSCSHSKCVPGGPLDASCDRCVADVCTEDPSCCSASWSASCVSLVASVCDAVCLSVSSETGLCVENAPGYQDSTCATYDLALGIPCSDQIPVCNHGTSVYSGPVTVGYYDAITPAMANRTPPPPTGTCSGSVNVAPGTCASLSCPSLPAGVLTMMLDPSHLLDECGDEHRRRDNWTVHDGRVCGANAVHDLEYLATCSEPGTVPLWGLLTYTASIPGSTTMQLLGRVGKGDTPESAALSAQGMDFIEIITADSSLQSCLVGSDLPCPLDLTERLGLEGYAGQHLDLRIVLTSAEGQNPHLSDFKLTYTCVYDQ